MKLWRALPLAEGVKLLEADANGLIALYKPPGVLSHPNENEKGQSSVPSLLKAAYNFSKETYFCTNQLEASKNIPVWLLHRLDSATSGVILASTNAEVAAAVKRQIKTRQVTKYYTALSFSKMQIAKADSFRRDKQRVHSWIDNMTVNRNAGKLRVHPSHNDDSAVAETLARIIDCNKSPQYLRERPHYSLVLLDLQPLTGYTHQLRFQASQRGLPIVGDQTYGNFAANKEFRANMSFHPLNYCDNAHEIDELTALPAVKKDNQDQSVKPNRNHYNRLFLHARRIELSYTLNNTVFKFAAEAPVPKTFHWAMEKSD